MEASQRLARKRCNTRTFFSAVKGLPRGFLRDRRAASVVEFALVTPIFLAVLGAAVDFGMAVRIKFQLNSALSAASSYALASGSQVDTLDHATTLASTLATLVSGLVPANQTNSACAKVNVNNGAIAIIPSGCTATTSSVTPSAVGSYYCPTGSGATITYGGTYASPTTCPSGVVVAGKFIVLTASLVYTPMIMPTGVIHSPITATSVVQVQ